MTDVFAILILLAIVAAAAVYIVRAKKRGVKCVGCPDSCTGCRGGCSCNK